MSVRFGVLGSGSSGNACYLQADGFGLLIDAGLGPRALERTLAQAHASWDDVHGVILSHTHGDHCRRATLNHLLKRRIPVYCHPRQQASLEDGSQLLADLRECGLLRDYPLNQWLTLGPIECRPFAVPHDDVLTCGFRFEGDGWAVGYAADLGSWTREIVAQLVDVDLLALEFNHDVAMQRASGRTPWLISRNLGRRGHLSNVQAAALLQAVLQHSPAGRLRHLVQLHLSEQCNTVDLAQQAALQVVGNRAAVHTAVRNGASPWVTFEPPTPCWSGRLVQAYFSWWEEAG